MELLVLGLFLVTLLICILLDVSILYALMIGYALFFIYGLVKKHSVRALLVMSWNGIKTARNVAITFMLIGMVTAVWRAGGTIAFIIYRASAIIVPEIFLLAVFLLCCLVSLLIGTSFGTAATAGIICMTISNIMGVNPILAGGAVLAGSFFGDRCSPMSTSALLVSELTGSNIYVNIKNMIKTALVPFLISCGIYVCIGAFGATSEVPAGVWSLFRDNFSLHWTVIIPAALILTLAALRVKVKWAMIVSILSGILVCLFVQDMEPSAILPLLITGFRAENEALSKLMDGGGVLSMARVTAIICLSSCYAGIFDGTGLLKGVQRAVDRLAKRITPFGSLIAVSVVTGMTTCNQTLSIMLVYQLFKDIIPDRERLALGMENTTVVIAPLIPWSIACATPMMSAGAPTTSVIAAFYLYILPLYRLLVTLRKRKQAEPPAAPSAVKAS